jgi:hypothetical protein
MKCLQLDGGTHLVRESDSVLIQVMTNMPFSMAELKVVFKRIR